MKNSDFTGSALIPFDEGTRELPVIKKRQHPKKIGWRRETRFGELVWSPIPRSPWIDLFFFVGDLLVGLFLILAIITTNQVADDTIIAKIKPSIHTTSKTAPQKIHVARIR